MDNWIKYKDNNVYYRTEGAGKPVVLVHGLGEDGNVWDYQVDVLKRNYALIIPDIPGSGRSEMNSSDWTMEKFAEVIKSIFDKEKIEKSVVISHSMGGYISLAFAEKYPASINGFGLFHSTAYADSEEKKEARRKGIEFVREHGAYEFLKQVIPNLFADKFKKEFPDRVNALIEVGKNFTSQAVITYYECMINRPDRSEVIRKMICPVLFIIGTDDKAVSPDDSLKQSHLPDVVHLHILDNVAHMGMWEEPQKTAGFISAYLEAIE